MTPSSEPSHRDGSNEGSQYMFLWSNKENFPKIIPVTPPYLDHCLNWQPVVDSDEVPYNEQLIWIYSFSPLILNSWHHIACMKQTLNFGDVNFVINYRFLAFRVNFTVKMASCQCTGACI